MATVLRSPARVVLPILFGCQATDRAHEDKKLARDILTYKFYQLKVIFLIMEFKKQINYEENPAIYWITLLYWDAFASFAYCVCPQNIDMNVNITSKTGNCDSKIHLHHMKQLD